MRKKREMADLELTLFGKPQVTLKGEPVADFITAKTEALFYYLVITGRPQSRARLAELLWADVPEAQGRRSLTKSLSVLRRYFEPYLQIEPHEVAFVETLPYSLDVTRFEQLVENGDIATSPDALAEAVGLYRGDFLEGFFIRDALAFEDWLFNERERLRELMLDGLEELIESYLHQSIDLAAGIEYAQRLLTLEPWRESAQRQLLILLARNGQRSAALAQYEVCRQVLDQEFGAEPSPETTELFEYLKEVEVAPPHNLPLQYNPFVGRTAELRQISLYLNEPACRLLTLVGPGGIGKTRLAQEAAVRFTRPELTIGGIAFADGVYFVNLAPLGEPKQATTPMSIGPGDQAAMIIAETLGLALPRSANAQAQLGNLLRDQALLLILDNFEYVAEGGKLVAGLLRAARRLKLLVTSRERLNLREERLIELGGLSYPLPGSPAQADGHPSDGLSPVEGYSSVIFFQQQARRVRAGLTFSPADEAAIVRICQLVEGAPLALELAASWLRILTCVEIAAEIERNLDFLKAASRNIPQHHRSFRVVFDHSWKMLSPDEQAVFARMSVFSGGFQPEAAEATTGATLPILSGLVDKSLLRRTTAGRYEVHELLRQYATEKLWLPEADAATIVSDPGEAIWLAYSNYYLQFVSQRTTALRGSEPQPPVAEIRAELDNIRRAWEWAVTYSNLAAVESCLAGLSRFYDISGLWQEGERIFTMAVERLLNNPAPPDLPESIWKLTLCRLRIEQARFLARCRANAQAQMAIAEAVELADRFQNRLLLAMARRQQGEVANFAGDYLRAQQYLEIALDLIEAEPASAETLSIEAEVRRDLGNAVYQQGRYAAALDAYHEALDRFRRLKDRRYEGIVLMNMGSVAFEQGDYEGFKPYYDQALKISRETGDYWGEALILNNRGFIAYEMGDFDEAQIFCQQALHLYSQHQVPLTEGDTLHTLGTIMRDLGSYDPARTYYERGLQICLRTGDQKLEGLILADLSLLTCELGRLEQAQTLSRKVLQLSETTGALLPKALALTHLGHILLAQGDLGEAATYYQRALTLRQGLGEPHRALAPMAGLALAELLTGHPERAVGRVDVILERLAAGDNPGPAERFRCYWRSYQILQTALDRRAGSVLEEARHRLQDQAQQISDPAQQQAFLQNVPVHRDLIAAFRARG